MLQLLQHVDVECTDMPQQSLTENVRSEESRRDAHASEIQNAEKLLALNKSGGKYKKWLRLALNKS
eukprot:2953624-Lingulodinium_polyedra.AAC.1